MPDIASVSVARTEGAGKVRRAFFGVPGIKILRWDVKAVEFGEASTYIQFNYGYADSIQPCEFHLGEPYHAQL